MYCQRQSNNLINKIHEWALRIAYNDYISNCETLLEKDEFGPFCPIFVFMASQRGSKYENFLKWISKIDSTS